MKNTIIKSLMIGVLTTVGFSCADPELDPLQFEKVKKGTLLALRGDQLDAIYWNGEAYGAAFYANAVSGTETFDFDAEYLSEDASTLSSVDIFVVKRPSKERVALTSVPASAFEMVEGKSMASISLSLSSILTKLGADLSTQAGIDAFMEAYAEGVTIESDLNLADGTKVLSKDLVAAGLYESDQFYPAQILTYGVEDIDDARPVATTSLRGQYAVVSGKVVRTIIPLKDGAKDTLNIVFDQSIDTPPTIDVSPATAGTVGSLVAVAGKDNTFYVPFTAGATYTGNATFTISGATSAEAGALAGLEQVEATAAIAVDNLAPQNLTFTTGTRVGKGQSATITLTFNEAIGTAPTVTIDPNGTGIDGVTDVKMTLNAAGTTATYSYEYKDLNGDATHGNALVKISSSGKDRAGNAVAVIADKTLTIDIGAAPAPIVTLDAVYDWGTQIKWAMTYVTGVTNPGGSTSGTVYFVAQESGKPAPTGFVGGDVPAFIMAEDPASTEDPKEKVVAKQTGTVAVTAGTSGTVYSAFTPNGVLDVYVVFVSSTGVISAISAPTTVTMN